MSPKMRIGRTTKQIRKTTEGKCPYCHRKVQSLEAHVHDSHKGEKLVRKKK